jgi:hypothetical protein
VTRISLFTQAEARLGGGSMTGFQHLLKNLHDAEQTLMKQLAGIRTAISSLQMGSAVSPAMPNGRRPTRPKRTDDAAAVDGVVGRKRKRRKMSAAARAKISAAQRARWAKQKSTASPKK